VAFVIYEKWTNPARDFDLAVGTWKGVGVERRLDMIEPENLVLEDQQARLARTFLDEYLHHKGLDFQQLAELPAQTRKQVMIEASVYASVKLAEIEDRAQLVRSLHHTVESIELSE
jgi:hypothetical protein